MFDFVYDYCNLTKPNDSDISFFENKYNEARKNFWNFDVVKFANSLGIKVFMDENLKEEGCIEYDREYNTYSITINAKQPKNRIIFTIAHEIAHFVCDKALIQEQRVFREVGNRGMPEERRKIEVRANKMAADILMPSEKFIELWNSGDSVKDLSKKFCVSEDAVKIRLSYLLGVVL